MKTTCCLLLAMLAAAHTAKGAESTAAGLLFHYDFEQMPGGVAISAGGTERAAVATGVKQVPGGVRGMAARFNGRSDHLRVPAPGLSTPTFSAMAWVYPENFPSSQEDSGILGKHRESHNVSYFWIYASMNDGVLHATMIGRRTGQFQHISAARLVPRRWTFVALTFDGQMMTLFVDGTPVGVQVIEGYAGNEYDMLVGAGELKYSTGQAQRYWPGCLDEVRYYDRCLTDREILSVFQLDAAAAQASHPGTSDGQRPALPPDVISPRATPSQTPTLETVRTFLHALDRDQLQRLFGSVAPAVTLGQEVSRIQISNALEGDKDVTVFQPNETMFIRVQDVDIPASVTGTAVRVMLMQEDTATKSIAFERFVDLKREKDDAFSGTVDLQGIHAGEATLSILGVSANGSQLYRITPILIVP